MWWRTFKLAPHFTELFEMKSTTKYDQRMRRLSCKIFNEFYVPEVPPNLKDYGLSDSRVISSYAKTVQSMRVVYRHMEKPFDLDPNHNYKYYPAHPQMRALTNQLREIGLYRDEHRDFNEAFKEIARQKGKVFRERRGPNDKKKAKK